ncbi:MAG: hypothetical protein FH753_02230 [Firmicutes bacterium]|nr:hypothetical protein [Bacillota bacterium]
MNYKVGIPQGLLFYEYYPLWKEFFSELGVEVLLSTKTNKKILDSGVSNCVDDACLPVKVFHGHVIDLKDKVDFLFVPKIISVKKREFECPKILGLPEMVSNTIKDLPPIIDPEINLWKSEKNISDSITELGKVFNVNKSKTKKAYKKACNKYYDVRRHLNSHVIPIDAIKIYNKLLKNTNFKKKDRLNILLLGHPYNIYDEYISMNIIEKMVKQDINLITSDMVDTKKINYYSKKIPKRMFWTAGRRLIGSAYSLLEEEKVNGIIYVSSFGCGLDSILIDLVQRKASLKNIPFTLLTIDEHTGEAGINTRIEAFIDMMKWRLNDENNISTHG